MFDFATAAENSARARDKNWTLQLIVECDFYLSRNLFLATSTLFHVHTCVRESVN